MKHLILVLALALVSCKKDDPEPAPPPPAPITEATTTFLVHSRHGSVKMYLDYKGDSKDDTIIESVFPSVPDTIILPVKKRQVSIVADHFNRFKGDTAKMRIYITNQYVTHVLSDTLRIGTARMVW